MNILAAIPPKARIAFYLLYALAGPVLIYTQSKGWTGQAEFTLWVGIGSAFGVTAAANVRERRRVPVEDVPHEPTPMGGIWGGA